jgi:S1-C subfamily serine protease
MRLFGQSAACLVAALMISGLTDATPQDVPWDILKDSVVRIESGGEVGSGIVLHIDGGSAQVLTAYHVVVGGDSIAATFRGDPATVWSGEIGNHASPEYDLALLRIRKEGATPATDPPRLIVRQDPRLEEVVRAIGHDGDNSWMHTDNSRVTRETDSAQIAMFRFSDRGVREGYSGGPVFNSRGELVGITVQTDGETAAALKIHTALQVVRDRFGSRLLNRLDVKKDDPAADEDLRRRVELLTSRYMGISGFSGKLLRELEALFGGKSTRRSSKHRPTCEMQTKPWQHGMS